MTGCSIFNNLDWAFIGVIRSYSSHTFLCALVLYIYCIVSGMAEFSGWCLAEFGRHILRDRVGDWMSEWTATYRGDVRAGGCMVVIAQWQSVLSHTWLNFVHEMAVPISRSPQCSWWGLVLVEKRPSLTSIYRPISFREMWFIDWLIHIPLSRNPESYLLLPVSDCFLGDMLEKHWSSAEYRFWSLHDHGFRSL